MSTPGSFQCKRKPPPVYLCKDARGVLLVAIRLSPGKTKRRFWAKFHLFSAYGTPSAIFPPICLWNLPISAYFLPKMVPHPCYKLKHGPICCFSTHKIMDSAFFCLFSAHFLPIFCLTFCPYSAGPVLPGSSLSWSDFFSGKGQRGFFCFFTISPWLLSLISQSFLRNVNSLLKFIVALNQPSWQDIESYGEFIFKLIIKAAFFRLMILADLFSGSP